MLHELTKARARSFASWEDFVSHAANTIESASPGTAARGVYVFRFANESPEPIYDYPNDSSRRQVVVQPGGSTIRTGKFEGGCRRRFMEYDAHLHKRPPDSAQVVRAIRDCFEGCHVLTVPPPHSTRDVETRWRKAIDDEFLRKHNLLAGKGGERRYLRPGAWTPEISNQFREFLDRLGPRLCAV